MVDLDTFGDSRMMKGVSRSRRVPFARSNDVTTSTSSGLLKHVKVEAISMITR